MGQSDIGWCEQMYRINTGNPDWMGVVCVGRVLVVASKANGLCSLWVLNIPTLRIDLGTWNQRSTPWPSYFYTKLFFLRDVLELKFHLENLTPISKSFTFNEMVEMYTGKNQADTHPSSDLWLMTSSCKVSPCFPTSEGTTHEIRRQLNWGLMKALIGLSECNVSSLVREKEGFSCKWNDSGELVTRKRPG